MTHLTIGLVAFLLLCGGVARVDAQEIATSFEQLAVLVKPGDKISVVEATGRETKGRVWILSRDALVLTTPDGPRQLGEADVAAISQRRDDSLMNGAIIGAVAGAAYVATAVALLHDSDGGEIFVPTAVAGTVLFAGLGAAAGAGIDALIAGRQVIDRKAAGRRSVTLSPLVGRGRRGAAVTVTF